MSWVEHIRGTYDYNQWANEKVLEAAGRLSDEQLLGESGGSRGTLAENLVHLVETQMGWTAVVTEMDYPTPFELPGRDILAALRGRFDESHRRLREVTDGLTEESLSAIVRPKRGGREYAYPRWQLLMHVANHSTQHRAEIGLSLLALDASPGDLDAIFFFPDLASA